MRERREVEAEWPDSLNEARRAGCRQPPGLRKPERRQAQRRRWPPAVWDTLGFLMVRGEGVTVVSPPLQRNMSDHKR